SSSGSLDHPRAWRRARGIARGMERRSRTEAPRSAGLGAAGVRRRPRCRIGLPAAAAAATAAATTAAAAATAEATATAATTATAAAATLALLGFVDAQRATVELDAIHLLDGGLRFLFRAHLDECEAARATRLAITGHEDALDRAPTRLEGRAQRVF